MLTIQITRAHLAIFIIVIAPILLLCTIGLAATGYAAVSRAEPTAVVWRVPDPPPTLDWSFDDDEPTGDELCRKLGYSRRDYLNGGCR